MSRDDKEKREFRPEDTEGGAEDRITRRQAMKRIAVAGAIATVPGAMMACGGGGGGSSSTYSDYIDAIYSSGAVYIDYANVIYPDKIYSSGAVYLDYVNSIYPNAIYSSGAIYVDYLNLIYSSGAVYTDYLNVIYPDTVYSNYQNVIYKNLYTNFIFNKTSD